MKPFACTHHGFGFRFDWEALAALMLSRPERSDMRAIEALAQSLPLEILEHIPPGLLPQAEPSLIHVRVDDALKAKLEKGLASVPVPVTLVTTDSRSPDLVRRMLRQDGLDVLVVPRGTSIPAARLRGLVILDGLGDGWDVLPSLDAAVVVGLVPEARAGKSPDALLTVPIRIKHGSPVLRQRAGRTALEQALRMARFSRLFERLRGLRLRWVTRWDYGLGPDGRELQVTMVCAGEERVLNATDLNLDLSWAEVPVERFGDVSGHAEAVATLRGVVAWLQDPDGSPGLRAFVLDGPPGTGKSLLARAMAGEAGAPCFLLGGGDFANMWFGETERRIRETFSALRHYDLAVIVLDEFDALAWRRDGLISNSGMHQAGIVGQLLKSLDDLRQGPGRVVLMATTNQYDQLDPALVRSMRIGERLHLGLPSIEERRDLLASRLGDRLDGIDLDEAEDLTAGLSQADLVSLVDRIRALSEGPEDPVIERLREAVLTKRNGPRNTSIRLSDEGRRRVALHEAGHAVVAWRLLGPDQVRHISLVPAADGRLGATFNRGVAPTDIGRAKVQNAIAVLLAGRATETVFFPGDGPTCGCESDLKAATELATVAVSQWGLDPSFPLISLEGLPDNLRSSLAGNLIERIQAWIREGEDEARTVIQAEKERLRALADLLMEKETLHGPDIKSVLGSTGAP